MTKQIKVDKRYVQALEMSARYLLNSVQKDIDDKLRTDYVHHAVREAKQAIKLGKETQDDTGEPDDEIEGGLDSSYDRG